MFTFYTENTSYLYNHVHNTYFIILRISVVSAQLYKCLWRVQSSFLLTIYTLYYKTRTTHSPDNDDWHITSQCNATEWQHLIPFKKARSHVHKYYKIMLLAKSLFSATEAKKWYYLTYFLAKIDRMSIID